MPEINGGHYAHKDSKQAFELLTLQEATGSIEHRTASFTLADDTRINEGERAWDLLLAFPMLFVPMLAMALTLLASVYYTPKRVKSPDNGTVPLPVDLTSVSNNSYYTMIGPSKFVLVSSWASTAAQFVIPPFMPLFSFFVARETTLQQNKASTPKEVPDLLQGLLKGSWPEIWRWMKSTFRRETTSSELRPVHVAAVGALAARFFA